jgi:hypothetical protein
LEQYYDISEDDEVEWESELETQSVFTVACRLALVFVLVFMISYITTDNCVAFLN